MQLIYFFPCMLTSFIKYIHYSHFARVINDTKEYCRKLGGCRRTSYYSFMLKLHKIICFSIGKLKKLTILSDKPQ